MVEIGKVVYKYLSDKGLKVYPIVAPIDTPLPFITYERSLQQAVTKDGRSINTVTFNIYVLSEDYKETLDICALIDDTLQPIQGEQMGNYIQNTSLMSQDEIYESGIYIQKMVYTFKAEAR